VGRQTFRFRLPSGFIVNLTDGGLGRIEALRCGGLGAAFRRGAGVANQVILEPGTGQRAGDQTTDKQPYPCYEQRILLDGLKDRRPRRKLSARRFVLSWSPRKICRRQPSAPVKV